MVTQVRVSHQANEHLTRLDRMHSLAREFPQIWGYPSTVKEAADRANKAWYHLAIA